MSEESISFKTALSGFNREDVLRYIEQSAKKHHEKFDTLTQEAETQRQECAQLREKNEMLSQKNADLLERLGEMTVADEKNAKQLATYKNQSEQYNAERLSLQEQIASLEEQLALLQQQKDALATQAAAFDQAKEKLAEMELSAHQRAKEMEERARFDAKRIRVQSAEIVGALKKELETVCEEYRLAMTQAQRTCDENTKRASALQEKLAGVLSSLDEVIVGELAVGQAEAPERLRMQQLLESLRGKEGE